MLYGSLLFSFSFFFLLFFEIHFDQSGKEKKLMFAYVRMCVFFLFGYFFQNWTGLMTFINNNNNNNKFMVAETAATLVAMLSIDRSYVHTYRFGSIFLSACVCVCVFQVFPVENKNGKTIHKQNYFFFRLLKCF